jgi:hypothetical protein
MEPTASGGGSGRSQTDFDSRDGEGRLPDHDEVRRDLSADSDMLSALPAKAVEEQPTVALPPVWLQRVSLVVYVSFCIEIGLWLIIVPWKQVWTANSLVANYPSLRAFFHSHFVRGLVTGLGFVDLWLGISEAVQYREKKPK